MDPIQKIYIDMVLEDVDKNLHKISTDDYGYTTEKLGKTTMEYRIYPDHIELSSIRTSAAHRGKGYAKAAMISLTDKADTMKLPIRLVSSPLDKKTKDIKLRNFYKSHGFVETGEKANSVGDPWMERKPKNK